MKYLVIALVFLIAVLLWRQLQQMKLIKALKKQITTEPIKVETDSNPNEEVLFWMRFPLYSCLVFILVLFALMFISISGLYSFSSLQLLFLTLSSLFFVSSDLCLVGINMNSNGIAPKWVEAVYKKTSRNSYKRFFWIAFICFITSFILHSFEPNSLKGITDIINQSYGILSLCFVLFIYGIRSLEEISKHLKKM